MTDLRTAAQQALEALTSRAGDSWTRRFARDRAIEALEAALAEPVPTVAENATTQQQLEEAPPSDYRRGYWDGFAIGKREGRIEAEDEPAQQAEPVEPVAWSGYDLDGMVEAFSRVIEARYQRANPFQNPIDMDAQMALRILRGFIPAMKAHTAPPQRKPLPKHDQHCVDVPGYGLVSVRLVRAVERAHGIKENPDD